MNRRIDHWTPMVRMPIDAVIKAMSSYRWEILADDDIDVAYPGDFGQVLITPCAPEHDDSHLNVRWSALCILRNDDMEVIAGKQRCRPMVGDMLILRVDKEHACLPASDRLPDRNKLFMALASDYQAAPSREKAEDDIRHRLMTTAARSPYLRRDEG